jgi:mono/diheme cytochrome c family protein
MSEVQANMIVAYLRSMPAGLRSTNTISSLTGDPVRGKALFEGKGNCSSCHAINGVGGTTGPDLGAPAPAGRGAAAGDVPPVPGGARGGGRGRGGAPGAAGQAGAPRGGAAAQGAPRGGGGRGGQGAPDPRQLERAILDPSAEMAPAYRVYQVVTKSNVTARGTLLNQDTFSVQMRDSTDKLMSFWKQDLRDYGFLPSPMPSYRDTLTSQEVADLVSYLISLRSNP